MKNHTVFKLRICPKNRNLRAPESPASPQLLPQKNNAAFTVSKGKPGGRRHPFRFQGRFRLGNGSEHGRHRNNEVLELVEDLGAQDIFEVAPEPRRQPVHLEERQAPRAPLGIISGLTTPFFPLGTSSECRSSVPPRGTDPEENSPVSAPPPGSPFSTTRWIRSSPASTPGTRTRSFPATRSPSCTISEADYGVSSAARSHKMNLRTESATARRPKDVLAKGGPERLSGVWYRR